MKKNDFNGFLAEVAFAGFNAEIKANEAKIRYMERSLLWERQKQSYRSTLSVLLQSANLTRKELNFVLADVREATPDELLKKIRFVSERITENDPAKMFRNRCEVFAESFDKSDYNFERELVIKANKKKKLF